MVTKILILTNSNTVFGPYLDHEEAQEAREGLARRGDSLGIHWPKRVTRVARVRMTEDLEGHVTMEEVK